MVVALAAGCSDSSGDSETEQIGLSPMAVVSTWLDSLASGDFVDADGLVEPVGLAVLIAVENNLRSDELVAVLEAGIADDALAEYWAGFRDGFGAFRGSPLAAASVGEELAITGADGFISVAVTADGATGRVILRHSGTAWQVDFVGTVGTALVGPLGEYLSSASAGEHGTAIAAAYRDAVVPGLDAAIALDPDNSILVFEAEYIRQLASS